MKYLAQVAYSYGGGFAIEPSVKAALASARRQIGVTARDVAKNTQVVWEFPEDAEIEISTIDGSWSSSKPPTQVVHAINLPEGYDPGKTCRPA